MEISEADARSAPLDAADPFLSGEIQGTEKVSDAAWPCLSIALNSFGVYDEGRRPAGKGIVTRMREDKRSAGFVRNVVRIEPGPQGFPLKVVAFKFSIRI